MSYYYVQPIPPDEEMGTSLYQGDPIGIYETFLRVYKERNLVDLGLPEKNELKRRILSKFLINQYPDTNNEDVYTYFQELTGSHITDSNL